MILQLIISILLLAPPPQQPVSANTLDEQILEAARTILAERFPTEVNRLDVKLIRTGGKLDPQARLLLDIPTSSALPRAHVQAKIQQFTAGQWQAKGWVMLYVSHFDSVAVSLRPLKKDEQLTEQDVRFVWMETTKYRGAPLTPAGIRKLLNKGEIYADRHLSKERALREGDLRNALDVNLGQAVTMTYKRDQFTLEFTCKARNQGFVGDEIKLFAPATNRTYRARITEPGKAEWLETLP